MILSFYLIKRWSQQFFILLLSLCSIGLMGDLINNVLRSKFTLYEIGQNIYVHLPMILEQGIPVSAFLSSILFMSQLKTHSELVSILAMGVSLKRIALTILPCTLIAPLFLFWVMGFFAPKVNFFSYQLDMMAKNKEKNSSSANSANASNSSATSSSAIGENSIWIKRRHYFLNYKFYDQSTQTLFRPSINFIDDAFHPQSLISAEKAVYHPEKKKWIFLEATKVNELSKLDFPVVEESKSLELTIEDGPQLLGQFQSGVEGLNLIKLYRFISQLDGREMNIRNYQIQVYRPFGSAFICLILIFLPILRPSSISARSEDSGSSIWLGVIKAACILSPYFLVIKILDFSAIPVWIQVFTYPLLCTLLLRPWTFFDKERRA